MDFKVEQIRGGSHGRKPRITIENEALFIALRLAKIGFYGGNPERILKAPVDIVLRMLDYEQFEADLSKAYEDIAKGSV